MPYKPDLSYAFQDNVPLVTPNNDVRHLSIISVGNLTVTSGRILACDPLAFWEDKPFTRTVPAGKYPVYVTYLWDKDKQYKRVAFARLQFVEGKLPTNWELALQPNQDVTTLGDDELFGYGVDAGTGCFMDADAIDKWKVLVEQRDDVIIRQASGEDIPDDPISARMRPSDEANLDWWSMTINEETGLNVIAFTSGFGDGSYPSYWGLDESNQPICLVTDFLVVDSYLP
jgi:Protein of unknown function (DUF4241)